MIGDGVAWCCVVLRGVAWCCVMLRSAAWCLDTVGCAVSYEGEKGSMCYYYY